MPRAQKVICKKNDSFLRVESKLIAIYHSIYKNSNNQIIENNNFFSNAFKKEPFLIQELWDDFEEIMETYEIFNFGYKSSNKDYLDNRTYMWNLYFRWNCFNNDNYDNNQIWYQENSYIINLVNVRFSGLFLSW